MAMTSSQSIRSDNETMPKRPLMPHEIFDALVMAITSSQSIRSKSETMPKCPLMPREIFDAAIKGDSNVLIGRLGLQPYEQIESQEDRDSNHEISQSTKNHSFGSELMPLTQKASAVATIPVITTEASHSNLQQIKTEHNTVQSELQSTTGFGDTVLHLLVTKGHNKLALQVFQREKVLLKAQNKMLETPLHSAVKARNLEFIQMIIRIDPSIVKDVLQETNEKGDTALHVAIRYYSEEISIELMMLDPKVAYKVNNEMLTPLYIATEDGHTNIAKGMIKVEPNLACTQFFNGMFPIHLAASKNNHDLVWYFVEMNPDYAELVDPNGRNILHVVAEKCDSNFLSQFTSCSEGDREIRMTHARDYEGNTPLHIASMKGHSSCMKLLWEMNSATETVPNNQYFTPYDISKTQLLRTSEGYMKLYLQIHAHDIAHGRIFSEEWFDDVMNVEPDVEPADVEPDVESLLENKWERTQVIGLGSVLITTVTFAAAFTIPGGSNQDHGTPVLGKKYMFWTFILANTLSFIQGFLSLFALLVNALPGDQVETFDFAAVMFLLAASTMVVTFGLGLYVTLAPVCLPIAILLLVITLFIGSPTLFFVLFARERNFRFVSDLIVDGRSVLAIYAISLLFIFGLALLIL